MGEAPSSTPPPENSLEDRLDSWKEIAAHLNRDVTTVQRWEKREGMPVHRHLHDRMGSVYASRAKLDAWVRTRNQPAAQEAGTWVSSSSEPAGRGRAVSTWNWKLLAPLAALAALTIATGLELQKTEYFWHNPIANSRLQTVTDFDGVQQDATVSRDGRFVAFLSDRDGQMDVWVTQLGSGEFHNLTHGGAPELINPSIRTLEFSPDGSLVMFWVRKPDDAAKRNISIWAVPTLGGQPRPYLEKAAELDWSRDGTRIVYHTPEPGDPLFVSDGTGSTPGRPIFTAPAGLHSHFPVWAPDASFIYFVQGSLPDKLDIWRISPAGGTPERITSLSGHITHPVFLDRRTLMYLANDADGSGPWLYSMDVEHRVPHRLSTGLDRYTSLAVSADSRRLVLTLARAKRTLWRLPIISSTGKAVVPVRASLTTDEGFSPRFSRDGLVYLSTTGAGDSLWKLANGVSAQLWSGEGAHILGGPSVAPDGRQIAFSVQQGGRSRLYVVHDDGTNARMVSDSLDLQGAPAWAPDGQSLTTAANDHGVPHLFRVPLDRGAPALFVKDYSIDPLWAPDGRFMVYSGPDVGTNFSVKAVTAEAASKPFPSLILTRGARHLAFLPGGRVLVLLRGEIQHKDLWIFDLDSGAVRQLTNLPENFDVRDFDISPDGRQVVLERLQERSEIVLMDLARR